MKSSNKAISIIILFESSTESVSLLGECGNEWCHLACNNCIEHPLRHSPWNTAATYVSCDVYTNGYDRLLQMIIGSPQQSLIGGNRYALMLSFHGKSIKSLQKPHQNVVVILDNSVIVLFAVDSTLVELS